MIRLILGQTSLHQRLETVDEQLDILSVAVGLGEAFKVWKSTRKMLKTTQRMADLYKFYMC